MPPRSLTDLKAEMQAVARGERPASPRPAAPLLQALTQEAFELLGYVIRERPRSIAAIVAATGRHQPNVSRSLQRLETLGLVRLHRDGRQVWPEPLARSVRIDLGQGTYRSEAEVEPA